MSNPVIILDDRRPKPPFEPEIMAVQITVYESGDVTVWLADAITEASQFNWLASKIAEGMTALLRQKAERSGTL
jgi:hypothetical protein